MQVFESPSVTSRFDEGAEDEKPFGTVIEINQDVDLGDETHHYLPPHPLH